MKSGRFIAIILALALFDAAGGSLHGGGSAYAQSPRSAAVTVKRLAERGDVNAQAELGLLYSTGRGLPRNYHLAARWYRRAAERGHGGAQLALGLLYNKGEGVPKNFMLAYMWLNLSAAQAVGEFRDFKIRLRDSVAAKLTPDQLEEAQHLASVRVMER